MEKIEVNDLEFIRSGSDAGMTYNVVCPECKMEIKIAESAWWDTECDCGYHWTLLLQACGTK